MKPRTGQLHPTDAELALAARNGEGESMGILLERYRPRLYASALAILGYGPQAQDAVHDAYLIALQKIDQLREPAAVGGWLHAILRNICLMTLRARPDEIPLEDLPPEAEPTIDLSPLEGKIEEMALRDWVWTALSALPETLRVTAMLRYFGSFTSYEEVARILQVPVGTVRSRLSQVKLKLAEALLRTAGLDHDKELARNQSHAREIREKWHNLFFRGERAPFLADFAAEVALRFPDGELLRGIAHLENEANGDLSAGSRLVTERVLSCRDTMIVEGGFINAPETPFRCPPGAAFVLHRKNGRIDQMIFYFSPRPPAPEE